jgi:hypothetical protein
MWKMFHTLGMDKTVIQTKWDVLSPMLDERARRLWAAAESESLGWGGITLVSEVTGLSRQTIHAGLGEIHALANGDASRTAKEGRMRTEGGGRKSLAENDLAANQFTPATMPLFWKLRQKAQLGIGLPWMPRPRPGWSACSILIQA